MSTETTTTTAPAESGAAVSIGYASPAALDYITELVERDGGDNVPDDVDVLVLLRWMRAQAAAPVVNADHLHVALDALSHLNAAIGCGEVTPWADYDAAGEDDPKGARGTYRQVLVEARARLEDLLSIA